MVLPLLSCCWRVNWLRSSSTGWMRKGCPERVRASSSSLYWYSWSRLLTGRLGTLTVRTCACASSGRHKHSLMSHFTLCSPVDSGRCPESNRTCHHLAARRCARFERGALPCRRLLHQNGDGSSKNQATRRNTWVSLNSLVLWHSTQKRDSGRACSRLREISSPQDSQ